MSHSTNSTIAATLIATAVGVGAWFFGMAKAIWPAHPQITAILMTVVTSIVIKQLWPLDEGKKQI
jgi:hypothetical protein